MYHEDEKLRIEGIRCAGIVVKGNKVLMIHRIKNDREYWVFPGGHKRKNENTEDCVTREIKEETGVKVNNLELVFEFRNYKRNSFDYYYLCDWVSGEEPELQGEEKIRNSKKNFYEPVWIKLNDIVELNVLPKFAKEWFEEYFLEN